MPSPLDAALQQHRAGRLEEAAALYWQSLAAEPGCALAWNMLGNVEYQRGHIEDALQLIDKAIELDPAAPAYRITLGHVYRRKGELATACVCYRKALDLAPDSSLAALSLADALRRRGELVEAVAVLQGALTHRPDHPEALAALGEVCLLLEQPAEAGLAFTRLLGIQGDSADALFGLGVASSQQGNEALAIRCFEKSLVLRPEFPEAIYNLGVIAAAQQRLEPAEAWFRRALAIRPGYVDAQVNLSAVLLRRGRAAEARKHREAAYRQQCVFVRSSRTAQRTVLILFDAGRGNVNLSHLFWSQQNNVIDWMIEYAAEGQAEALPPFDLVFNAMGDPDMTGAAGPPAARFIAACRRPVLNRPEAVAQTARDQLPALLQGIDGLFVPDVRRIVAEPGISTQMRDRLPLLVRPVDTHGGEGLQLATSVDELDRIVSLGGQPLYVAPFCDFRSDDGWYRKYRVIFIDRQPFPYHLAISPHWLVHYATADMEEHPWKVEEERRFLEHPERALGEAGLAAIAAIGARMDLDYAGVDFSVLGDGRIVVFEANPVMFAHPEDPQGVLAHKNPYVARIFSAFEALLARTASVAAA
jgi:tetratricopeptide (TPR) repeat protein